MSERQRPGSSSVLPAAVRAKMISLCADAVAQMPTTQVPPVLRKLASFAPAKRARLVGTQLADAVAYDETFRGHLAIQVRAMVPVLAALLDEGLPPEPADVVESAAVAYVLRPEGWADIVEQARMLESDRLPSRQLFATVERLEASLDRARGDLKSLRIRSRAQTEEVKADNSELRRTLNETRAKLKAAEAGAANAWSSAQTARRFSAESARGLGAEVRRLRARVAELESDHVSARRAARDEHSAETARLRLLLDTVMDAASGLRRELALPPSELVPADTVVALEPTVSSGAEGVGRAMMVDDPALLRRLLELPRVHLIIDGYNVSKTAWPTLPLDQQRGRLTQGVGALTAGRGTETTVVFDGADLTHPPPVVSPRSVRVRFSPPGMIADDLIRQLVEAEPVGRPVVVVSTDRELATSVTKKGARSVASLALVRALGHSV